MSQCALEFAHDAAEGQPCPRAFGSVSRRVVMNTQVADVVGLYHNPPQKAVVLCVDEKSR
jgi:hypothetical protein